MSDVKPDVTLALALLSARAFEACAYSRDIFTYFYLSFHLLSSLSFHLTSNQQTLSSFQRETRRQSPPSSCLSLSFLVSLYQTKLKGWLCNPLINCIIVLYISVFLCAKVSVSDFEKEVTSNSSDPVVEIHSFPSALQMRIN